MSLIGTNVDVCRERGWGPGTVVEFRGEESEARFRLTGFGEDVVLARQVACRNYGWDWNEFRGHEAPLCLDLRDAHAVGGGMVAFGRRLAGGRGFGWMDDGRARTMRYWFELCPNRDVTVMHTDVWLPKVSALCGTVDTWPEPDPTGAGLAGAILAIDGVVSLSMGQYRCQVEKARLFRWADLVPQIVEAVGRGMGCEMVEAVPDDVRVAVGVQDDGSED